MKTDFSDERIYASLRMLNLLQHRIRGLSFLPKQPVQSLLSGRHASRVRGRGLNFEEIRAYQPGDDVRTIDWKVTARTRSPHTRVFTEERDRPVLIVVDQRVGMFFGTQAYMKSVTCAQLAALTAWQVLEQGDRVGGLIFNDSTQLAIPCRRNVSTTRELLSSIVRYNHMLSVDAGIVDDAKMLSVVLEKACRIAAHDFLVVVISDFNGLDESSRRSLKELSWHNDVIGMLVHDPTASHIPNVENLVVSDGELQLALDGSGTKRRLSEATSGRLRKALQLQQELDMTMLPVSTADEALPQLLKLMGGVRRR